MGFSWPKRLILTGIFALSIPVMGNAAFAEEELIEESAVMEFLKSIEFSGFVDTYYSYNFNRPATRGPGRSADGSTDFSNPNALRAFDVHDNSFTLNNVELIVAKEATEEHPVGFGFVTMYGEQANFITFVESNGRVDSFTPGGNSFTIQQGYVTLLLKGFKIKMGKFATWIGYELIESVDNPNYSRSYLYQNAIPFTNTGISVGIPLPSEKFSVTGFLVNGWDTFVDNNTAKTLGYQVTYALSDNLSFCLNGSHGAEQEGNSHDVRNFWDFYLNYSPWEKVAFSVNYDHGTEENVGHWHGVAAIGQYFFTDAVNLAVRGEWFKDSGSRTGAGYIGDSSETIEVYEVTGTLNIRVAENLYVRPEVRYDWAASDKAVFAGPRDNQVTALLAAAYTF